MSSAITEGMGNGGMGSISKRFSKYRVEKTKLDRSKESELAEIEDYSPNSVQGFADYLKKACPYITKFNLNLGSTNGITKTFEIPANSLSTEEAEDMLAALNDLGLVNAGVFEEDLIQNLKKNSFFSEFFKTQDNIFGDGSSAIMAPEIISLFLQLREFLIVEYLNSLNSPYSENIIHNYGFFIEPIGEYRFKANIQLEDWSGQEKVLNSTKKPVEGLTKDDELVSGHLFTSFEKNKSPLNLKAIIEEIEDIPELDKRSAAVKNIFESLEPVAQTIDFINADQMQIQVSENGETVTKSVRKLQFSQFDIKPDNIFGRRLLDYKTGKNLWTFVIGDFGISALPERPNKSQASGTPGYAAPEIFLKGVSEDVSKSDIYSFAVTIFELLTSRRPENFINSISESEEDRIEDTPSGVFPEDLVPAPMVDKPEEPEMTPEEVYEYVQAGAPKFIGVSANGAIDNMATNYQQNFYDIVVLQNRGIATSDNVDNILRVFAKGMAIYPQDRYSSCEEFLADLNSAIQQV